MINYIYFISFIFMSTQAFASDTLAPGDKVTNEENTFAIESDDIRSKTAPYLSPKDYTAYTHLNRDTRRTLFNTPGSIGETLRQKTDFPIRMDDRFYFFEEFIGISTLEDTNLNQDKETLRIDTRPKPSSKFKFEVKNLPLLLKEKPEDFKKLFLASIPKTQEDIQNNLESYYKESMKIDDLIGGLPNYKDSRDKLAHYLVEYLLMLQVGTQVRSQVVAIALDQHRDRVRAQAGSQFWEQVWEQVGAEAWDQIRTPIRIQFMIEFSDLWDRLNDHLVDQIRACIESPLGEHVRADLSANFDYSSATEPEEWSNLLKPTIDYTFAVYLLGSLAMRHTTEFKAVFDGDDGFAQFVKDRISEDQAQTILENLKENFPEAPKENFLVESQLKILKRHLPN